MKIMAWTKTCSAESLTQSFNQVAPLNFNIGGHEKKCFQLRFLQSMLGPPAPISQAKWESWVISIENQPGQVPKSSTVVFQSTGAHLYPCITCKSPTPFFNPFGSSSLTILSRIMHFPYVNYLIWSTTQLLLKWIWDRLTVVTKRVSTELLFRNVQVSLHILLGHLIKDRYLFLRQKSQNLHW